MRTDERGQEIVERHNIGHIQYRQAQSGPVVLLVKKVVCSGGFVEYVSRRDASRIVVRIGRAGCGEPQALGAKLRRGAVCNSVGGRGPLITAKKIRWQVAVRRVNAAHGPLFGR